VEETETKPGNVVLRHQLMISGSYFKILVSGKKNSAGLVFIIDLNGQIVEICKKFTSIFA